jgi:hypothetical protein
MFNRIDKDVLTKIKMILLFVVVVVAWLGLQLLPEY